MSHDVLQEQIAYYRARAPEYDASIGYDASFDASGAPTGALARGSHLIEQFGPCEEVLELACGTGIWTRALLAIAHRITAVDISPEMLDLNARKVADPRVHYQLADLFSWEPAQQYDLVFFANWLSHVPPDALDAFLDKVVRAVRPGGKLAIVDQYAPTPEDRSAAKGELYAERTLADGRTFTIVKVFYDLSQLQDRLAKRGFAAVVHTLDDIGFLLVGTRNEEPVC